MTISTCVFDAYGTLFDVAAAARLAAAEPGAGALAETWPELAATWRRKQLQYSWLRAVAGAHEDFWRVTGDGLDYALDAHGIADEALRERLLALYWELSAYPEVPEMLATLKDSGFRTAILSNGSPEMLEAAITSAGIGALLDAVLSVESVGVFKPHRRVYEMVGQEFGTAPEEVLFTSSNGWDAAAGAGFGFHAVWVNRTKEPEERLPWRAATTLPDLRRIPVIARGGA